MPDLQVWVVECLFATDTFGGIEAKHLGQEIGGKGICIGEEGGERDSRFDREGSNVVLSTRGSNTAQCVFGRRAQIMEDLVELINVVPALEDRFSTKKLCKNTANGPDIYSRSIVAEAQHDFGSSVPTSCNIFSHEALVSSCARGAAICTVATSKAKVTNLEIAVGIDKQISGLEITMKDVGGVDVLQTTEGLIKEGLEVSIREGLS